MDVAGPRFISLGRSDSSLVNAAFYDASDRYAIIILSGTAYRCCGMPAGTWAAFSTANSLGRYYSSQIKCSFECLTSFISAY